MICPIFVGLIYDDFKPYFISFMVKMTYKNKKLEREKGFERIVKEEGFIVSKELGKPQNLKSSINFCFIFIFLAYIFIDLWVLTINLWFNLRERKEFKKKKDCD